MEYTAQYHDPATYTLSHAGLFVSVVNPHLIKNFVSNSLHRVKSNPADARKISRYTLDNLGELRQNSPMDNTESIEGLKFTVQLFYEAKGRIALLDNTYPGVNKLFSTPAREDGSEKWG